MAVVFLIMSLAVALPRLYMEEFGIEVEFLLVLIKTTLYNLYEYQILQLVRNESLQPSQDARNNHLPRSYGQDWDEAPSWLIRVSV